MQREPLYEPTVEVILDAIENDPGKDQLWNAIVTTLEMICDESDQPHLRRRQFELPPDDKHPGSDYVFAVPIRDHGEDDDWTVLWRPYGEAFVLILYVGTSSLL